MNHTWMVNQKPRVVYLIGAGASHRALPIVSEMRDAFRHHVEVVKGFSTPAVSQGYVEHLLLLGVEAERYGTIDTYARALFLQSDMVALQRLKHTVGAYFTLTQVLPPDALIGSGYSKPELVDTRYLGWLAVLLRQGQPIDEHVRVLSWNYDLQIEHALALYGRSKRLQDVFEDKTSSVYPNCFHDPTNAQDDIGSPFLIHLNGVAGMLCEVGKKWRYVDETQIGKRPEERVIEILMAYSKPEIRDNKLAGALNWSFSFAWENTITSKLGLERAKFYLQQADVLVAIGYSFPSFNRSVDRALIASFCGRSNANAPRRLVVQSPSMTEETLKHMFDVSKVKIRVERSTTQFYLPPDLFV